MIDYLSWDSEFFGHKIGKLTFKRGEEWPTKKEFSDFDMVYVFSDEELEINAPLIDVKLTFYKLTEAKNFPHTIERFDTLKHDYQQLLKLVYLSGHDSRFKKDSFFGEQAFKSLYKQWINNSLKAENTKVLVYQDSNKLLGFIAMKEEHSEGFIDLIAVSPEAQGQGVGQQLIDAVEASLGLEKELYVPTQQTNEQACHFYEKCGFKISDKQYIYHYAKHTL